MSDRSAAHDPVAVVEAAVIGIERTQSRERVITETETDISHLRLGLLRPWNFLKVAKQVDNFLRGYRSLVRRVSLKPDSLCRTPTHAAHRKGPRYSEPRTCLNTLASYEN